MAYKAIYKCRLCGRIESDCVTGSEAIVNRCMQDVVNGIDSKQTLFSGKYNIHFCNDGSFGLSDFQGFKAEED